MERALYHTYRPQVWEALIGQESVKLALTNQVEHGPLGHAFLFSGPRAVGKTSAARLLAKSANCTNRQGAEPCNTCEACVAITGGAALDVVEIDAASHTGVDHVREHIIQNARVAPSKLVKKVFIIDEVHMLSTSAFNALLKTLEEPPEHALFVLATTELHKVPATIISRCQHFHFNRVPVDDMVKLLTDITQKEKKTVEDGVLKRVAYASEGCVRDAQSLLAQVFSLGDNVSNAQADLVLPRDFVDTYAKFAESLLDKRTADGLAIISGLVNDNVHLGEFGKSFVQFLRSLLIFQAADDVSALTEARLDATVHRPLLEKVKQQDLSQLAALNALFLDAVEQMRHVSLPTLPLEIAVVKWTQTGPKPVATPKKEQKDKEPPAAPPEPPSEPEAPKEPDPEPETPSTPASPATNIDLSQITAKWEDILSEVKKENPTLTATLTVGQPIQIEDGRLTIAFKFPFHKERVEEPKNRDALETVIESVVGGTLPINCTVDPNLETPNSKKKEEVENIEPVSEEEMDNVWNLAVHTFGEDPQESQSAH